MQLDTCHQLEDQFYIRFPFVSHLYQSILLLANIYSRRKNNCQKI